MQQDSIYKQNHEPAFMPNEGAFMNSDGGYKNQTGDANCCSGFWCCYGGCVIKGGASLLSTLGSALISSNANVNIAKATHQNPLNKSTGVVAPPAPAPVSHTKLYITLGAIGVLALSGGIFLMVRKSGKAA